MLVLDDSLNLNLNYSNFSLKNNKFLVERNNHKSNYSPV